MDIADISRTLTGATTNIKISHSDIYIQQRDKGFVDPDGKQIKKNMKNGGVLCSALDKRLLSILIFCLHPI